MGYRERRAAMISERAMPHLEPGETIQIGFFARTAPPANIFATGIRTVVVTDRAFLVIGDGQAQRLRRDIVLGKPTGMYHAISLDRRYWVHRDYYREVVAADAALREKPPRGEAETDPSGGASG